MKNVISKEYCAELVEKIEPLLKDSAQRLYHYDLFGPEYVPGSFDEQDRFSEQFTNLQTNDERRGLSMLLNAFSIVKKIVGEFYDVEITMFEGGLIKMEKNAVNKRHMDLFRVGSFESGRDGFGDSKICQFSAILYLSEYGKDFLGGELEFEKQDLSILPEPGLLVFFPGDKEHIHEVKKVTNGARYGITMFMGYE